MPCPRSRSSKLPKEPRPVSSLSRALALRSRRPCQNSGPPLLAATGDTPSEKLFSLYKVTLRPDDAHGTGTGGEGDCEALCSARAFYNTYTQNTRRMGHRSLGWDENEALAAGGNSPPPRHGGVETVSAAARQQHGCYADLLRSASSKSSSKSERWAIAGRGAPASDFGLRACSKRHRKRFTYR